MQSMILVVDDDEMVRLNLEAVLRMEGYGVRTAESGPEALGAASTAVTDLIVLDISMPGMDGWETLRRLRRCPETSHLPVVALTGDCADAQQFRRAGFNAYLSKGSPLEHFLCTIRCSLEKQAGFRRYWLHSCNGSRCLSSPMGETGLRENPLVA